MVRTGERPPKPRLYPTASTTLAQRRCAAEATGPLCDNPPESSSPCLRWKWKVQERYPGPAVEDGEPSAIRWLALADAYALVALSSVLSLHAGKTEAPSQVSIAPSSYLSAG